jgi:outer membrane receptor protein involved in Fe transport
MNFLNRATVYLCKPTKLIYRYILIVLFFTASLSRLPAQTGVVIDAATRASLPGATISNITGASSVTTNAAGYFEWKNRTGRAGDTMIVSHAGYLPDTSVVTDRKMTIALRPAALKLAMATVTGQDKYVQNKISALDLLLKPIQSSQDILRSVPGLFIAQHAGGGKAEQIFLRGYDIDHGTDISITADGLPVNMISHAHGQGYADLHFLIPETVERVNFDKGPYRADKGNLATAGYVDFKTRDFLADNSLKLEAGRFNTRRAVGMFKAVDKNTANKRAQLYLAGELFKADGYFESSQNFKRANLLAKYTLIKNENTRISFLASAFDSKWTASGQIPDRAVKEGLINRFGAIDDREGGNTSRYNTSLTVEKRLRNNWQWNNQLYFSNYRFNLFSNFTFFLEDSVQGDMINQRENRNIFGASSRFSKHGNWGALPVHTEAGAGLRYDDVGNIELSKAPGRIPVSPIQKGSVKEANVFAFVNQQITLANRFDVNAGLRFDYFNFGYKDRLVATPGFQYQNRTILSPKLNFGYTLSKKARLFLNNGLGFHSNDTRVILNRESSDILPRVFGTDLGISITPRKGLFMKLALWQLYSRQEFVYVGDAGIVEPSGRSQRMGVDAQVRWQATPWLFADVDVNVARARAIDEAKGADYIPLAPLFTSIGGLTAKLGGGFSAALRYRFLNDRPANEDNSVTADGYLLTDATLNYEYKKWQLHLVAENIFNRRWKEAQFETTSRLLNEAAPVTEIHYTPGSPFFIKAGVTLRF